MSEKRYIYQETVVKAGDVKVLQAYGVLHLARSLSIVSYEAL